MNPFGLVEIAIGVILLYLALTGKLYPVMQALVGKLPAQTGKEK